MDNVETTAGDIDLLMQGTGLLALASRAGQPPMVEDALYQHCLWQIEDNQTAKGASEYLTEAIKFSRCVCVAEAKMSPPNRDMLTWWCRPLQSHLSEHSMTALFSTAHQKAVT
ncbi:hypothetical protein AAH450_07095 [Erwinia sp. P7711]|uniref:hypothetical protein n=1 Tax=Erwinia sp. P7711 TaxID=3141451 RepID=UPI0031900B96